MLRPAANNHHDAGNHHAATARKLPWAVWSPVLWLPNHHDNNQHDDHWGMCDIMHAKVEWKHLVGRVIWV